MKRQEKILATVAAVLLSPFALHYGSTAYLATENYTVAKTYELTHYALQTVGLQPIPSTQSIDRLIDAAADKYKIDRKLLHALASVESNKNPTAVSLKGAVGVMQIMGANYKRCGLAHPGKLYDEATNIDCGALILSQELASNRTVPNALRVYNAGPSGVKGNYPETERYVMKIGLRLLESKS